MRIFQNILWGLLGLAALATGPGAHARQVQHVVLISLDGSRPEFYMDKSWDAPNLQHLKDSGVYAAKGLTSVFPSVTFPSHTTMVTGAYPARHGIYYNIAFGGKKGHWYWEEGQIRSKTLWDAVAAAGMTAGAVMWPVTVGAPIAYNFPERRPEAGETGDLLSIKRPFITPASLLQDMARVTGKDLVAADLGQKNFSQSKATALIASYMIKTYKPNLLAIHFLGIDHAEHAHGTDGPQIREMVRVVDSLVGTILQAIREAGIDGSTAVIITGDHGHVNTKATFAPNVYLSRHHWVEARTWKAKFHADGGSAFLYLGKNSGGNMLDSVRSVIEHTPEYRDGLFRILDRKTLDRMGANPEVALGLAMKEGYVATDRSDGKVLVPTHGQRSTHGYDPVYPSMHTSFIAVGAGIDGHHNIEGMGIEDIAPLVARLLDLDFEAPDGTLVPGILKQQK